MQISLKMASVDHNTIHSHFALCFTAMPHFWNYSRLIPIVTRQCLLFSEALLVLFRSFIILMKHTFPSFKPAAAVFLNEVP